MNEQKINLKYILITAVAVTFTWILHEFSHWITSEILGYESIMRLNSVSPVEGQNPSYLEKIYISAAGPAVTILQAVTVYFILYKKQWNKYLYAFLFTPLYMRILAGFMNIINPNDEGRIGISLGIGVFTLSILVTGILFLLVYRISKKYELNRKFNFRTTLIVMVISSILILSDQFLAIRIL